MKQYTLSGDFEKFPEYTSTYEAAINLIGNPDGKGTFDLKDLVVDVDAINMGEILNTSSRKLNEVFKEYYTTLYQTRYSDFVDNKFSGNLNEVKTTTNYMLTTLDPGISELRLTFLLAFKAPGYTLQSAEDTAQAFKDLLSAKINEG